MKPINRLSFSLMGFLFKLLGGQAILTWIEDVTAGGTHATSKENRELVHTNFVKVFRKLKFVMPSIALLALVLNFYAEDKPMNPAAIGMVAVLALGLVIVWLMIFAHVVITELESRIDSEVVLTAGSRFMWRYADVILVVGLVFIFV